jgi:hypothetical protein
MRRGKGTRKETKERTKRDEEEEIRGQRGTK